MFDVVPTFMAEFQATGQVHMGFIGALIGAGSALLGGILNRNSAKKQQSQAQQFAKENSIVDMKRLVKEANAAGFNPLTALMAGAGSPAASNYQQTFNPALSSGGFIAEAVQRGADTYFNTVAERDAQAEAVRREAEDKRRWEAEMDLKRSNFGYSLTDQQAYAPPGAFYGPRVGQAANQEQTVAVPVSGSDEMVNPSVLPIKFGGRDFTPSGQYSDAEAAESRYGEIAGEVLGIGSLTHDLGRNARRSFDAWAMSDRGTPVTKYQKPKVYDRGPLGPDPYAYRSPFGSSGPTRGQW